MILGILGVLLALPPGVYLGVTLIEWATGTDGGIGVFGSAFDGWTSVQQALLVVGAPLLGLVLLGLSSLRLREATRSSGGVAAMIEFRMSRGRLGLTVLTVLLTAGAIAYWFVENWPCTFEGQWIC